MKALCLNPEVCFFIKQLKKKNAKKAVLDAHIDTIGFAVEARYVTADL